METPRCYNCTTSKNVNVYSFNLMHVKHDVAVKSQMLNLCDSCVESVEIGLFCKSNKVSKSIIYRKIHLGE